VTKVVPADASAILEAARILRRGGLVAFPTETVYGLGADAENQVALRALFAAKGRPADHPVIMHLADTSQIETYAAEVPTDARRLAAAFWPGPLTLVLRRNSCVSNLVTGGLETVGLRIPVHPVAQSLLREFGGPIAAPSANRFGRVSCTRAEHVLQELDGLVDLILDDGECDVGLESTIIDLSRGEPAILRPGAVTAEMVANVLGNVPAGHSTASPRVSGSLPSHYAPRARVEIVASHQIQARANELNAAGQKVAVLCQSNPNFAAIDKHVHIFDLPGSAEELAHSLYALLRQVDDLACNVALITLPSQDGLGTAIADRLRRAAGPRGHDSP
jgi:L-threonylcarbamoyladenylate synthase